MVRDIRAGGGAVVSVVPAVVVGGAAVVVPCALVERPPEPQAVASSSTSARGGTRFLGICIQFGEVARRPARSPLAVTAAPRLSCRGERGRSGAAGGRSRPSRRRR